MYPFPFALHKYRAPENTKEQIKNKQEAHLT